MNVLQILQDVSEIDDTYKKYKGVGVLAAVGVGVGCLLGVATFIIKMFR